MTCPICPSKALPVPLTPIGLLSCASGPGLVIDIPSAVTEMASQMPPLLLPSRRESVTVMVPLTTRLFRTRTTALTSCAPPPLSRVVEELGDQLSKLTARAPATIVALSYQDWCPCLPSCWSASAC